MVISKLPYTVAFADELHADGIAYARTLFERVLVHSDKDYLDWIEEADGICNRAKVIPSADLRRSQKVRVLSKQGVGGTFYLSARLSTTPKLRRSPVHRLTRHRFASTSQSTRSTLSPAERRASPSATRLESMPRREFLPSLALRPLSC